MIRAAAKTEIIQAIRAAFARPEANFRSFRAAARQFFRRLAHQRQIMRKICDTSSKCTA